MEITAKTGSLLHSPCHQPAVELIMGQDRCNVRNRRLVPHGAADPGLGHGSAMKCEGAVVRAKVP